MAVVAGGSKCNLITGWKHGEDSHVNFGKKHWLAQTFTLDELYVVYRCRLKSWTTHGGKFYHYAIKNTDGAGKPTGADLAHTTLSPTSESFYDPGKWRRFDFGTFPNLPAGVYALVVSVPDSVDWLRYKLRCDSTDAMYPLGKAWESDDGGVTWTEIPNTDFMFEVWGWPPPPEKDPDPVVSNWAVLEKTQDQLYDGLKITVRTDIPCHLFMRVTIIEPRKHPMTEIRRGLRKMTGTYFCFVSWEEIEQTEEADVLIHTFIILDWPICQTRWFYFVGTKQAEEQPSASPLFKKHREPLPIPFVIPLYVTGDEDETNIRFIYPTTPPTHWDKVRYEDSTFDPDYGVWGIFAGILVYETFYYNDDKYRDLYTLESPPAITEPILKVSVHARIARNKYPYGKYHLSVKTHGTVYESPEAGLTAGFVWYHYDLPLNPFTGSPWTLSELQTLQAGVKIGKEGSIGSVVCDMLYVSIEI